MKNPIKNYFQKLYNETGKKPFTFLNAFLTIFLPIILFLGCAFLFPDSQEVAITLIIIGSILSLGINLALLITKFKDKGIGTCIGLFFLTILASILFFCSFILYPLLKASLRGASAVTQANLGNTTASVNASRQMGATKGKKSALNWFEYTGRVWKDEKEVMPDDISNHSLDEGSYSYEQNQQAKAHGYSNGKDAEMSGRSWNGNDWV